MSRPVPLTALKTFEVAARLLSFKRAAQELNVTPTAVSHQIQNLEETLGTKLFRRLPGGLELTSAGEVALPGLKDGFGKLKEAVELIGSAGAGDVLTVHSEVLEVTPSRSRPDRGLATIRSETRNQAGEPVQVSTTKVVVWRRKPGAATPG